MAARRSTPTPMAGAALDLDQPADLAAVLTYLCSLAAADHAACARARSGRELMQLTPQGTQYRHGHRRILTTVYRGVRWGLVLLDAEQAP